MEPWKFELVCWDDEVGKKWRNSVLLDLIQEIEPLDVSIIQKDVAPSTVYAMKRTISGMLGLLPSNQFQVLIEALWEPLSKLLVSSMMTGYTLRNVEYRLCLERNFDIHGDNGECQNQEASELDMQQMIDDGDIKNQVPRKEAFLDAQKVIESSPEQLNSIDFGELTPETKRYILDLQSKIASAKKILSCWFLLLFLVAWCRGSASLSGGMISEAVQYIYPQLYERRLQPGTLHWHGASQFYVVVKPTYDNEKTIILVASMDDLIIIDVDAEGTSALKKFLSKQFQIIDLDKLKYFLECELLGCKPADSSMLHEIKLMSKDGKPLHDPERYRRLIGKLNYLIVTRPDIAYPVSVVSQFMFVPRTIHWDATAALLFEDPPLDIVSSLMAVCYTHSDVIRSVGDATPAHYLVKMESFTEIKDSIAGMNPEQFESTEFDAAGPREHTYDAMEKEKGIAHAIPFNDFTLPSNGFLKNDRCKFGVEVFVANTVPRTVALSVLNERKRDTFTWTIKEFSKLTEGQYFNEFTLEGMGVRGNKGYIQDDLKQH
ncbi:Retrovirus-related Pol polyprotein from transposon RE2-like protein [Drosera capensis]